VKKNLLIFLLGIFLIASNAPAEDIEKQNEFECKWKAINNVVNFSIIDKKFVKYGSYTYPILFEDNSYILFDATERHYESKVFNKFTKDLSGVYGNDKTSIYKVKNRKKLNPVYANCKNIKDSQTTKIETSQTQKVAKEKLENLYVERMVTKKEKLDLAKGKIKIYRCSTSTGTHLSKGDCIGDYYKKELLTKKDKGFLNFYLLKDYNKTQITKVETNKIKKDKTKKVKKIQSKSKKLSVYNQSELELIERFKNYETNCEPVESKISANKVICIKLTDVLDLGKFREIQSFPEGMLKKKLNWVMLSKKAGQEVYSLFVKRGPQYHARYPGAMILGMSWYEIFYLNQLKKNKKVIERFVTFGPDNYNKYNNRKDPINSIKAKNFPKKLFQEDVLKISKLINNNKSKIKMREALGFSNEDKIEDVIKGQWILGTFLNNDKLKAKKVILDPELKKRKILIARYKTALTKYKKKLEEKSN